MTVVGATRLRQGSGGQEAGHYESTRIDGGITAPLGFTSAAVHCGIKAKAGALDLTVISAAQPVSAAGLFTTNLAQVKGLDVLSTERILSALQRLGKKDASELDPATAREAARNAGADVFITGALMRTGPKQLRLDVRVQDTSSGQILFSDKVEAPDVQGIFGMVDQMTSRIAQHFAPSTILAANDPSIAEPDTSHLEAYLHYKLGIA